MHRVKGDRLVHARVLPVCDNDRCLSRGRCQSKETCLIPHLNLVKSNSNFVSPKLIDSGFCCNVGEMTKMHPAL